MAGMDMRGLQGQSGDIKEKLREGTEQIQDMGQDFEGVKQQLEGMPDGIDADIQAMIHDVETEGREEARADIESVQQSVIDAAKSDAANVQSDVQQKISDNATATGQLDGISSKYGRGAADRAKQALADNTQMGEDILSAIDQAIQDADSDINSVKSSL